MFHKLLFAWDLGCIILLLSDCKPSHSHVCLHAPCSHTHMRMNIHKFVNVFYSLDISLQALLSLLVQYSLDAKFVFDHAVACIVGAYHLDLELEGHGSMMCLYM